MIIYYNETKINSGRIGISYQLKSDTIFVTSVEKNGPSFKAGLKTGDKSSLLTRLRSTPFKTITLKYQQNLEAKREPKFL